jgi:hypothetical protein
MYKAVMVKIIAGNTILNHYHGLNWGGLCKPVKHFVQPVDFMLDSLPIACKFLAPLVLVEVVLWQHLVGWYTPLLHLTANLRLFCTSSGLFCL